MEIERGSTRLHSVENSLSKRLQTYCTTDERMMNIYFLIFIFVANSDDTENGQGYFIIQKPCAQVTQHCYGSLCRGNIARVSIK